MDNYYCFLFTPKNWFPAADILIAELSELGFEAFEEQNPVLKSYIQVELVDDLKIKAIQQLAKKYNAKYEQKIIKQENWNSEWEKSFQPIEIDEQCLICASFHQIEKTVPYKIIINPKMSFGTGHHQTTALMIKMMLKMDFQNKKVLDMGCGTGILSILAAQKKAKEIQAIDIDDWSVENAKENIAINQIDNIIVEKGSVDLLQNQSYDIILANINRNILMEQIPVYSNCLKNKGILLLSGFYDNDVEMIKTESEKNGLKFAAKQILDEWACVKLNF